MKNNNESKWIEYAFGELDSSEAELLRQELAKDTEAEKFVSDFEALRRDLKQLNEVPDHQLSTERLRHAILNKGLNRPKKKAGWLSWVWMPGTAAALTFATLFVMNRGGDPNVILPSGGSLVVNTPARSFELLKDPAMSALQGIAMSQKEKPEGIISETTIAMRTPEQPQSRAPRGKRNTSKKATIVLAGIESAILNKTATLDESPTPAGGAAARGSHMTTLVEPMPMSASEPIILITPENDSKTGARKAVEQSSSSNVSISG
ncbi:MAG: hypothetical protein KF784_07950 [Fimbriimonadaceae bacterium]|nr:hypothetical protein [Fimbriimonadaceae bacterium]